VIVHVYIDGFNLYYGALKNTPNKWLNVEKLCNLLFPNDSIVKIKYFTAQVKIRPNDTDLDKPVRQQIYLRALKTIPSLEIIEGHFLTHTVTMKNATGSGFTKVIKTEEKGTDVNIATHLVNDAHNKVFEMAVVISNDSDLVEPVRIVTSELQKPVIVVSPFPRNSIQLKSIASSVRKLRKGVLAASQFSSNLSDSVGSFSKPVSW
jgi:uncharacterized LabA/DUF88 family protein